MTRHEERGPRNIGSLAQIGRNMLRPYQRKRLRGGFGAEDALEAGARELDADELFALRLGIADVDDATVSFEVSFAAARGVVGKGDADFEVGADGNVETRDEGGAAAAQIFAGSFFFEDDAALIAAAHAEWQADGDPTFRALTRKRGAARRDHGLGPHFC
jgi:hypothetical protein